MTPKTIKKTASLALLAVALAGTAFAGPNDTRPAKAKLSIDVNSYCYLDKTNPRYLVIETTVTPSGSEFGDGGAYLIDVGPPTAKAALQDEDCKFTPKGKQICKNAGFVAVGEAKTMVGSGPFDWSSSPTTDPSPYAWKTSDDPDSKCPDDKECPKIDLCAVSDDINGEKAVNALVEVDVTYDGGVKTTWASNCDNVWFESDDYGFDDDYDRVDQSDLSLEKYAIVCD